MPRVYRCLAPLLAVLALVILTSRPAHAAKAALPYPGKGDADPHYGVISAKRHAVQGIDVSKWQNAIDWAKVKSVGTRFAFIKATEGGDYLDDNFRDNWAGARKAGVPRGAYLFVFWCRAAKDQANWFIRNVPKEADALPPIIDVEWNHLSRCPRASPAAARAKMREILVALHAHYGKKPVIYTDINFHADVLEDTREFDDYPFWIRSTAARPEERYEKRPWEFWQFTTTGRVPGIVGDVDRNAFFGSEKDFQGWKEGRYDIGTRKWHDSSKPLIARHAQPAGAERVAPPKPVEAKTAKPRGPRAAETRGPRSRQARRRGLRDPVSTASIGSPDRN